MICVDGKVKDLTAKYDSGWMTGTKKLRVEDIWWQEMISPYHVKETKQMKAEDEQIKSRLHNIHLPILYHS